MTIRITNTIDISIHTLTTKCCAFSLTDAPTVSVSDITYDQHETTRTLTCIPDGNPQSYTYYKWQHKSKYGVLLNVLLKSFKKCFGRFQHLVDNYSVRYAQMRKYGICK